GATPSPDSVSDDQPGDEKVVNENENAQPEDADQSPIGWGMADSEANADVDEVEQTPAEDIETIELAPRKVQAYRPKTGWDELANEFDLPQAEERAEEPSEAKEEALDATPDATETTGVDESHDVAEVQTAMPIEDISAVDEVADDSQDEQQQSSDEGIWFGADEFDALFDDSPSDDSDEDTVEQSKGSSFDEAIEAASKEIEDEKTKGKRRKRRRRRPRKPDSQEEANTEEYTDDDKSSSAQTDGDEIDTDTIGTLDTDGFGAGLFGNTESPQDAFGVFAAEEEVDDASEVLEISPSASEEQSPQDETKEGGKKRGRRRRRRVSAKKKESDAETSADKERVSQESPNKEAGGEELSEKSGRRGARKKRSAADREDSGGGRRERKSNDEDEQKAVSHRGIPSWDEAIKSIIATNMENRSKKSGGGSSSRSRGGRSRGGRDKSGSRKRSN
ncbi:MAG: hypothetical protein U9N87_09245, partial [Planctomycetota bacterium]|nr:hypothetical protein [Planctomycetota bacterium]